MIVSGYFENNIWFIWNKVVALREVKDITEMKQKLFSQKLLNWSKQRHKKTFKH